jgi:L-aspartate oxidase
MSRVVIAGSGIAGLTAALRLAGSHEVTVVTKGRLGESNTAWAQGGIAGVVGPDDSVDSHIADTLIAGAGHCDAEAVRVLCEAGGDAITSLAEAGVDFDTDPTGVWSRGLEGAHSHPRIFHSGGDATGHAIIAALTARLRIEVAAGRVRLLEHTMLLDVTTDDNGDKTSAGTGASADTVASAATSRPTAAAGRRESSSATGVTVLRDGLTERLDAEAVVLATGGAGQAFAHTTNPKSATGDGLAAAIRAGAEVRDLEFFQFHPTALAGPGFLISEAVRGAGALLIDETGHRFMPEVDPRAELAPRDVVALAIHRRSAAQEGRPCYLDARAVPDVAARFPSITAGLSVHGLDLAHDLIPVMPAAHYFMGGVATDVVGRTSIDRLFAIGEVACTGVHGANRLASNSLLEGAVFAARTAAAIDALPDSTAPAPSGGDRAVRSSAPSAPKGRDHVLHLPTIDALHQTALTRTQLQALTWEHLGVERTATGLQAVLDHLGEVDSTAPSSTDGACHDVLVADLETSNLALIAAHMARHASAREHSLGAHARTDTSHHTPTTVFQEAAAC